jgi:hypothetical protein
MTSYPELSRTIPGDSSELSRAVLIEEDSSDRTTHNELSPGQLEAKPKRIQLRRTKGWRKPEGAISVARPHKWGNPYGVGTPGVADAETAVRLYLQDPRLYRRDRLPGEPIYDYLADLTGHDLMCYCPPGQPCHADL